MNPTSWIEVVQNLGEMALIAWLAWIGYRLLTRKRICGKCGERV